MRSVLIPIPRDVSFQFLHDRIQRPLPILLADGMITKRALKRTGTAGYDGVDTRVVSMIVEILVRRFDVVQIGREFEAIEIRPRDRVDIERGLRGAVAMKRPFER